MAESEGMEPLCNGLQLMYKDADGETQTKAFSQKIINRTLPEDCYELYDPADVEDTPLAFIVCEYLAGTSLVVTADSIDPFEGWKTAEDIASYGVWEEEEGILNHLKHLKEKGKSSLKPPSRPLVVTLS